MHKIPVFYRPEQSCSVDVGFSPSAGKPALIVADWLSSPDIAPYIEIETFLPVGDEVLCSAHDPSYVEGIFSGEIVNGFGNSSLEVAHSLRYTTGSMLAACKHVLTARGQSHLKVACSPTSGFHHAGYDFSGGFCTFNGLMAAAIRVHTLGLAESILIIDMDVHAGNGTQDIMKVLGIDYIDHITNGSGYSDAVSAMKASNMLYPKGRDKHYDLVIYQAGADMHIDDPLGGLLTTEQMQRRDVNVFRNCDIREIPIVFNLAGGYKTLANGSLGPVIALHRQTMNECLKQGGFK